MIFLGSEVEFLWNARGESVAATLVVSNCDIQELKEVVRFLSEQQAGLPLVQELEPPEWYSPGEWYPYLWLTHHQAELVGGVRYRDPVRSHGNPEQVACRPFAV